MSQPEDYVIYKDFWAGVIKMPSKNQEAVFKEVVGRLSAFSEESITYIVEGLPAMYKNRLWEIWLDTCDLTKYSVKEVQKLVMNSDGKYAKNLWLRWLGQKDLQDVNLVTFASAIKDLSPDAQLECLQEYYRLCPNINQYGTREREKVSKILSSWAVKNLGIGSQAQPRFRIYDVVKINGMPYGSRIEAVIHTGDSWKYRLNDESRYFDESELQKV